MKQVLLVLSDRPVAEGITAHLRSASEFGVSIASTGHEALRSIGVDVPDALLIDVTLPDFSGAELCRLIRSRERTAHVPMIMLEERGGAVGPISGLEFGADDYMTKPFDPKELEARLRAVLRRHVHTRYQDHDGFNGVHLDANFAEVAFTVNREPVQLTKREFLLLRFHVHHRNEVVGRDALLANVWGSKGQSSLIVNSAIHKLRTKLREAGHQIETVAGFGYRFNEPPK